MMRGIALHTEQRLLYAVVEGYALTHGEYP